MKLLLIILTTIISLFYASTNSWGALSASTVWEVRATGANTNGGGFNATRDAVNGVDYSQSDTPILSPTNLYRVAASSLYSDTFVFTHAMEGNIIYIVSGTHFTAGWYEIQTYVDATHVTLDRDPASEDTSAHKDGVGNVGGAVDNLNTIIAVRVAGDDVYIKKGTYSVTAAMNLAVGGANGNPGYVIGYNASRTVTPTGEDRPIIDGGATATNIFTNTAAAHDIHLKNLIIQTATSYGISGNTTYTLGVIENCAIRNNGNTGIYIGRSWYILRDCELYNNVGSGLYNNDSTGITLYGCYAHDNGSSGFANNHQGISPYVCISESNAGIGFGSRDNSGNQLYSVAYNNTGSTSDGFQYNVTTAGIGSNEIWMNNISMNNGRYGFNRVSTTGVQIIFDYNDYNGNGTAGLNNITAGEYDITTDPLFTNPLNGDFTLQTGSPCIATGFPGSLLRKPGSLIGLSGTQATSNATSPYDDVDWTNPTRIVSSNDSYATASINNNDTYYLLATNFGLTVPTDATITGVVVKIEAKAGTAARIKDASVKLIKGGSISGDDKALATLYTTSDAIYFHGNPNDMWGLVLTPADVNASTFGVAYSAIETTTNATTVSIDVITVTIYYSLTSNFKWNIGVDQDDNTAAGGGGGGSGFFTMGD